MEFTDYQRLAMRTDDGLCTKRLQSVTEISFMYIGGIINASLGLSGEVGELNDMIKKTIFHGHPLEIDHVKKRLVTSCGTQP